MSASSIPPENRRTIPRSDGSDGASVTSPADSKSPVSRPGVPNSAGTYWGRDLLVKGMPHRSSFAEAWFGLWETEPVACPIRLGESVEWPKTRGSIPAQLTSFLFHASVVFFCYAVVFSHLFRQFVSFQQNEQHTRVVSYEFRRLSLPPNLPGLHQRGPGGAPGQGNKAGKRPKLGATHFDPRITIISNPAHPDNNRITVHNPVAPTMKLPKDLRVADLILGSLVFLPPAPPALRKIPKAPPAPRAEPPKAADKPLVPLDHVPLAMLDLTTRLPPIPTPHLEVTAGPPPPPQKNEVPPAPDVPMAAAKSLENSGENADGDKHVGATHLTTLSVDPIPLKDMGPLPPGNAEGAFSIGPAGTAGPGSPGGVPGGELGVGSGGPGAGGDKSVGVGKGDAGGGGGGGEGSITMSGHGSGVGGYLPPLDPGSLVYPVNTKNMKPRATGIIVSAGPSGGGGLRIYGVLHGEKIYTVYMSMPGRNWIMEYCAHEDSPKPTQQSRTVEVRLQPPLTPPDAVGQFDFHRPPIVPDQANNMIVLHGLIHEDGSVTNLEVLRGLEQTLDEAALAAFSRWKFRPALRAGTPVAVDILVGIPAVVPGG